MTKWEQIKINRGVSYGGYEDEEERKYKQQVEQNKAALEQYKQYVKQVEMREGAAQRNYERSQELSPTQIQGVVEGKNTPLELKSAEQRLNNIEPKYRGLLYAAAQSDTGGLRGLANKTRLMETMGMDEDNVARLYEDTQMLQKYGQAVRDGNGASYLSKDQKGVYAEMKHDELPDDLKAAMADYREKYTKELWRRDKLGNVIGAIVPDNTDLEAFNYSRKYGISVEDAQKYLKREQWLAEKEFQKTRDEKSTIDEDASSFEKFRMGVSNTAKAVANTIPGGFMALAGRYNERNSELGYNTDSYFNAGLNEAQHAQQEVSKNIDNKYLNFAYNTGVSTLQAAATIGTAALTGGGELFTLGTFAANSYATTYNEAKEKGLSDANADKLGVTSAVVETFTEWASLEHAYNIYRTNKAGGVNLLVDMLAQGGVEMSEEAASELLNDFAENQLIGYTGMSQRDLVIKNAMDNGATRAEAEKEATKDFVRREIEAGLGGFFSGLAMGGGANVISNYKAGKARKESSEMYQSEAEENEGLTREDRVAKEQAEIYAKNPVRAQVDMMHDQSDLGKERKAKAMKIAEAYEKKGKLNAKENFELQNLLEEDFTSNEYTDYKHYAEDIQGNVTNGLSEDEFSRGMVKAIKNGDIDSVADLYDKATHSSSAALRQSADEIYDSYKNMAEANGISSEQFEAVKMSTEEAYKAGYNNVKMENLTSIQKESYNDGVKARIEENTKEIDNNSSTLPSEAAKIVYKENYNSSISPKTYDGSAMLLYRSANIGATFEDAISSGKGAAAYSILGENAARNIFNAGKVEREAELKKQIMSVVDNSLSKKKGSGVVKSLATDYTPSPIANLVANKLGQDVLIVDKMKGTKAFYSASEGEIVVRKDSPFAMLHEASEFSRAWAYDEYTSLVESATHSMISTVGHDEYQRIFDEVKGIYPELTDAQVAEEVANDYMAAVALSNDGIEHFAKQLVEDHGTTKAQQIFGKIKDWFNKVIEALKNMIADSDMEEWQRKVIDSKIEDAEQLIDKMFDVMEKAKAEYESYDFEKIKQAVGEGFETVTDRNGNVELIIPKNSNAILINQSRATMKDTNKKLYDIMIKNGYTTFEANQAVETVVRQAEMLTEISEHYIEMQNALNAMPEMTMKTDTEKAKQIFHAFVNNGEYALNIDFLTVCKKREAYMQVLNDLIDADIFDQVIFDSTSIAEVNDQLREAGFETACLCCFVESRRLQIQKWAQTFVDEWNEVVLKNNPNATPFPFSVANDKIENFSEEDVLKLEQAYNNAPKNKSGEMNLGKGGSHSKIAPFLEYVPEMNHTLKAGDLINPKVLTEMRKTKSGEKLFSLIRARYGTATPKINQSFNPYNSEIADLTQSFMKTEIDNSINGIGAYNKKIPEIINNVLEGKTESYDKLPGEIQYMIKRFIKGYNEEIEKKVKDKDRKYKITTKNEEIKKIATAAYAFDVGGVRLQSFSDFLIENVMDYFQLVADMQAQGLPMHAYSKEIAFARIFGMTGMKINMSLIPLVDKSLGKEYAGLNADESYAGWGDFAHHLMVGGKSFVQSIGFKDAVALQLDPRYSMNVGTIAIGISDKHILKMLNDPLIRMIIPYHSSGMTPEFAKKMNIDLYTDYTSVQNTRIKTTSLSENPDYLGKATSKVKLGACTYEFNGKKIKTTGEFNFNNALQKHNGDAKMAAKEYLAWCAAEHTVVQNGVRDSVTLAPKFDKFAIEENYYKLLEDFNTYDYNNNAARQSALKMNYPDGLTADQEAEYRQRLIDSNVFVNEDGSTNMEEVEKYVAKAKMTLKEIIEKEAKDRNKYHREQDAKYKETLESIKENLKKTTAAKLKGYNARAYYGTSAENLSSINDDVIWLSNSEEHSAQKGKAYQVFVDLGKNIDLRDLNKTQKKLIVKAINNEEYDLKWLEKKLENGDYQEIKELMNLDVIKDKYDSITFGLDSEGDNIEYAVFDPTRVKSGEAATYDENGSAIPMDDRFNRNVNDIRFSKEVNMNSLGKKLTEEQKTFFKDSKVLDDEGRLMVLYHGSDNIRFTVFDPKMSDDGISFFMTDNKYVADTYTFSEDIVDPYNLPKDIKTYDDIVERFKDTDYGVKMDGDDIVIYDLEDEDYELVRGDNAEEVYKEYLTNYSYYQNEDADKAGIYELYANLKNPYILEPGVSLNSVSDIKFENEKLRYKWGSSLFSLSPKRNESLVGFANRVLGAESAKKFLNALKRYERNYIKETGFDEVDYEGFKYSSKNAEVKYKTDVNWNDLKFDGGHGTTRDVAAWAKENGYDGVIIKNIKDIGVYGGYDSNDTSNIVIAFSPEQIKSVNNTKPTTNPDIRFSKDIDADGVLLNKNKQKFFDKSQMRDEYGRLMPMYHGARGAGFTIFNPEYSDDGASLFFTDNPIVAKTYSGTHELFEPDKPMTYEELENLMSGYGADLYLEKDGDQVLVREYGFIGEEDEIVYSGDLKGAQNYFMSTMGDISSDSDANYKVYLNIENPYIVDANYAMWDELPVGKWREHFSDVQITDGGNNQYTVEYQDSKYEWHNEVLTWEQIEEKFKLDYKYFRNGEMYLEDIYLDENGEMIPTNTRQLSTYARKHGYDGVIIKNVFDIGLYASSSEEVESTVAIVFNGENVKSVWNENPTKNVDYRFAKDLDDVIFDILDNQDNPTVDESILAKGMEALKGKPVDTRAINKIVAEIKNETGSKINNKELSDMLSRAFAYLHSQNNVRFNDVISLFEEVSKPIVDNSIHLDNVKLYKDFTEYFKDTKIRLSETQMDEVKAQYGSYKDFQKAMYPLQFSVKGNSTLDSMWTSLAEAYPGLIEYGVNEGDMPATLNDVLNAIKPKPQNNFGANTEEYGKDLAMEIIQKYFESQTDAKVKKAAENLKSSEKEYREKVRKRYQERYAEAKKKLAETYTNKLEYEKKRAQLANDWDIADIKAKSKNRQMKLKDRKEAAHQKKMIGEIVNDINKMLFNPTEKKHVPSKMVDTVAGFISCLDFIQPEVHYDKKNKVYYVTMLDYNERYDDKNHLHMMRAEGKTSTEAIQKYYELLQAGKGSAKQKRWQESMRELADKFTPQYDEEGMEDIYNSLDINMPDALKDLVERNNEVININDLSVEDLKLINNALRNIRHAINMQNKAFAMKAEISTMAHEIMNTAESILNKKKSKFANTNVYEGLNKIFVMNMITPDTYFTMLGNGGHTIYNAFEKAFEDKIRKVKQTQEYMEELLKDIDVSAWEDTKNAKTFDVSEGQITMTPSQIMYLYELSKRSQAVLHFAGGIEVERMAFGKVIQTYNNQNKGIHLAPSELATIFSTLTDEQKQIADKMQRYLADVCGGWGNEASMIMYDFEKFLDPQYMPIYTDSDTNQSKNEDNNVKTLTGIERMGMTKEVNKLASNPLIVKSIFDVFTKHTVDMATYSAYAPTIKDALRVYNYKEIQAAENDTKDYIPVKKALNACVERTDNAGKMYFENFIRDVNGMERSNDLSHGFDSFISGYKAAAVGANVRVVVQQPTAYVRAATLIDPKNLLEAVPSMALTKTKMDELKNKHALIYWKSQGYYEANLGRSEKAIITGEESVKDKLINASMVLAGKADDITWSCLYNACERQIKSDYPGLSGDEYTEKVDDLFTQVIHETQVVDATIMKSEWQRSSGRASKLLTSFMAEPIKSYNMGVKAIVRIQREGLSNEAKVKLASRTAMTLLATDALTSLAQAFIDGIRHHGDDDDEYYEQVMKYWLKNMLDNINPLKRIPFIKDVWDALADAVQGKTSYGTSQGQLQEYAVLNSLTDAIATTVQLAKGDYKKTGYAAYMSYAKAASQMFGVPLYNFSKDMTSFWNFFANDERQFRMSAPKDSDIYNSIIYALENEKDDEYLNDVINEALEKNGLVKQASDKVNTTFKQQFMDAREDGDYEAAKEAEQKTRRGLEALGFSDDEIDSMIDKWTDDSVGMTDLYNAIKTGEQIKATTEKLLEIKDVDSVLDSLYKYYGKTIEESRDRRLNTDIEKNLNKVLAIIDGSDYDDLKYNQEKKAAEKEQKKRTQEAKADYKEKISLAIENGNINEFMISDYVDLGQNPAQIKTDITEEYREKVIELYRNKDSSWGAYAERIARLKAKCDEISGIDAGKAYKKGNSYDYYQYEYDYILYNKDWLGLDKPKK